MIRRLKSFKNETGQAMVIFAVAMVVVLGFVALAVDTGSAALTKSQLQNAADSAALAAAQDLPDATAAQLTAEQYAELNGVDGADITLTTPYQGDATKALITCTQTVNYTFAKILGKNSKTITTRAVAQYGIAGSVPWIVPFAIARPVGFNYDETYVMRMYGSGPYDVDYTYPSDYKNDPRFAKKTTTTYTDIYTTLNNNTIVYNTAKVDNNNKAVTIPNKNTVVTYLGEKKVGSTTWYNIKYSNYSGWTQKSKITKTTKTETITINDPYPYQFDYFNVYIDAAQSTNDYYNYLENGYNKTFSIEDNMTYYAPSSGGKAAVDRFNKRTTKPGNDLASEAKIGDPRVMLIPVVEAPLPDRETSPGTEIDVIGFAAFFVEEVHPNSYGESFWFTGKFLENLNIGAGQIIIDPNADFGLRVVNLIE